MKVRKIFALSILATSVALAAGCSSDDDDETPVVTDPGTDPDTDPGTDPDTDPGTDPDTDPDPTPVMDTTTNTGTSILDIARGTDGDGDGEIDLEGDAAANAELTSLVAAAAGYPAILNLLDDEMQVLTVFAPNNDAFAALTETPDAATLERILQYHVISGTNIDATAVSGLTPDMPTTFTTAAGADLSVMLNGDGSVSVTDGAGNVVPVIASVEDASNGTVHVIGSILMPPAVEEMPDTETPDTDTETPDGTPVAAVGTPFRAIQDDASLSSFETLVVDSGFDQSLADANNANFLTFAPTNAAIDPGVTTAAAYIVSSITSMTTAAPAPGTYRGTGAQAVEFVVTGSESDLMVNGQPATFVVSGDGGALVKYGS